MNAALGENMKLQVEKDDDDALMLSILDDLCLSMLKSCYSYSFCFLL